MRGITVRYGRLALFVVALLGLNALVLWRPSPWISGGIIGLVLGIVMPPWFQSKATR